MTNEPNGTGPDEPNEGGRKLDEDAAWREIVAHYGDEPAEPVQPAEPGQPAEPPRAPTKPVDRAPEPPAGTWGDSLDTDATWDDEGHFIPPVPPPSPPLEPRRRLAWIGLFGAPALMLLAVVFGWKYPGWFMLVLASALVGGFVYLVATMPRSRPGDGYGDDGAVV